MYTFNYKITEQTNYWTLKLIGRLIDNSCLEEIKKSAEEKFLSGNKNLLIDLSELEYVNSMGLNLLIQLQTRINIHDGKMVLCKPNAKILQLIQLTKLNSLFNIKEDLKECRGVFEI